MGKVDKQCTKCKETKSVLDFNIQSRNADGRQSCCRSCTKELKKVYREENAAKIKNYNHVNRKYINARSKSYNKKNYEVIAVYQKNYYKENKEFLLSYSKVYQKENKERIAAQRKQRKMI